MRPERWQRIKELFESALEREPDKRAAFLDRECAGDEALRSEVESLLSSHEQSESFMESPAVEDAAADLLADDRKLQAGQAIGRYEILSMIGEGGMGEVYLARDSRLQRKVALKMLPAYLSRDRDRLRRFEQEARAASALSHPNVCMIHEISEAEDGRPYIAMEYVEGETLRQRLEREPIKLGESLDVAVQVASALAAAHEAGIVHRDIKPENIMLRRDGLVKVLDFGLAKLAEHPVSQIVTKAGTRSGVKTEPGVVLGTAQYMSPEQARGLAVDARTDVWSLGCVLYEMAAGRAPFEGSTTSDVIAAVLEHDPAPLTRYTREVPEAVEWMVTKALRKDREERYQTAKELLTDLRGLKHRLEFKAELERSAPPNRVSGAVLARSGGQAASAARTAEAGTAHPTSSAEYIVGEIKRHKRGAVLALATLLLAAAAITYFSYLAPTGKAIDSIAVLPFANASASPDTEYLSDGLTESIINSLSRLSNLKVIARSSVFHYKGRDTDPQAVARELGVRAVLTGRVVQRGDSLLVSSELVDARDKRHLWGEQYNRRTSDLLAVQEEISKEITERLRLRLTGEEQKQLTKHYTENTEAYQAYLKGRYHSNKHTEDGYRKGIEYFNQAIRLDRNYALAYAGLADAYYGLSNVFLPPKEAMPLSKAAAVKALELDASLAEAHASLARIMAYYEWDWSGAERVFKSAVYFSPSSAHAHQEYGNYLTMVGRPDVALPELKRAQELDPLSLEISMDVGWSFYFARRYEEAIKAFCEALETEENWYANIGLGLAYTQKGMYQDATATLRRAGHEGKWALGYTYAVSGNGNEAHRLLDELKKLQVERHVSPFEVAIIHVGLGEKDDALLWLDKGYEERGEDLVTLKVDPKFDNLRADPRFQELLRRVGFPP